MQPAPKSYIAPIGDFKIGDGEEIKHAKLFVVDQTLMVGEMVIGIDFFLSHRIYVANSQRMLYLTYNGGPVFNVGQTPKKTAPTPAPTDAQPCQSR